jgi:hypothetical protein
MFWVVEDEPQPKLIVMSEQVGVQFLVESVIEQDKLIFALDLPRHQVPAVRVGMDESLLVYHFDDHVREELSNFFAVDSQGLKLFSLIQMNAVDILHYKHSFGRFEQQQGDVDVLEAVVPEEMLSPFHIVGFSFEIQLQENVPLKLFNEPLVVKLLEDKLGRTDETPHHLQILFNVCSQGPVLHLHRHLLPV